MVLEINDGKFDKHDFINVLLVKIAKAEALARVGVLERVVESDDDHAAYCSWLLCDLLSEMKDLIENFSISNK